jgi:hypothetical protein
MFESCVFFKMVYGKLMFVGINICWRITKQQNLVKGELLKAEIYIPAKVNKFLRNKIS